MSKEREYRYFIVRPSRASGMDYNIFNKRTGLRLGFIAWYPPWRCWVFQPQKFADTVWSSDCLADIQDALAWAAEGSYLERQQAKRSVMLEAKERGGKILQGEKDDSVHGAKD